MTVDRRQMLLGSTTAALAVAGTAGAAASAKPGKAYVPFRGPRARLIFVNDLSGDVDGLFAVTHAVLSPAVDLRAIVGSSTGRPGETAEKAAALANELLALMGRAGRIAVHAGAVHKLAERGMPVPSAGTQAIIDEAMRTDTELPLYVAVGGGLTEIASALMLEPRIADRLTLVWNGGDPYPKGGSDETNFGLDRLAAQHVFNETRVRIWQIPLDVLGRCVISDSEIQAYVAPCGKIGAWLYGKIIEASHRWGGAINTGETYSLGDSPLVLVTALQDWTPGDSRHRPMIFEKTGSSPFDEIFAPRLNDDGTYAARTEGRKIRVYKSIDTRLMFGDFFAKLRINFG